MAERGPVSAGTGAGLEPRLGGLVGAGFASALLFGVGGFLPALVPLSLVCALPLVVQRLQGGAAERVAGGGARRGARRGSQRPAAATVFLLAMALPGLVIAEALARGRGLLRGCAFAFFVLVAQVAAGLAIVPGAMAERVLEPIDRLRSEAVLKELAASGMPADAIAEFNDQVDSLHGALGVVYPAFWVIAAAVLVAVNAALLRSTCCAAIPGWLEDGEFERVRFPLPLVIAFVLSGAAVALPVMQPAAYNVLLVVGFFFVLQGLAVVSFYARRLAAPPLVRALALTLVLVNPWAPQMLALLGLFDNFFDFRRWAEPPQARRGPDLCRDSSSRTIGHGTDPEGRRRKAGPPRRDREGQGRLRAELPAAEGARHAGHRREQGDDREGEQGALRRASRRRRRSSSSSPPASPLCASSPRARWARTTCSTGSVTSGDVAEFLKAKGIEIDKRKIQLDEPIKHLGEHELKIKLHPEVDRDAQAAGDQGRIALAPSPAEREGASSAVRFRFRFPLVRFQASVSLFFRSRFAPLV
jgi:uncharacterized protein YybS (DUF2232 family)